MFVVTFCSFIQVALRFGYCDYTLMMINDVSETVSKVMRGGEYDFLMRYDPAGTEVVSC